MSTWLRRIRGAVGITLVWGTLWAVVGALKAVVVHGTCVDALWIGPPIGVFPGVVGGLLFSALLAVAESDRRLHELSLLRVATWGAMVGGFLGFMPVAINEPPAGVPGWQVAGTVIASLTLLGALSAVGSFWLSAPRRRSFAPFG